MSHQLVQVDELTEALRKFAEERDWERFHSPKNLAMALSVEVAELLEIFQWRTEAESRDAKDDENVRQAAADEVADIIIYVTQLADKLNIDIDDAVVRKLARNAKRLPASRT